MANLYIGVNSKARLVKNIYIGVNGKARKVQKAYIGVGGKARLFYSASTPFAFTYTGSYSTEGNLEGNFVIRFKTSGTLKITSLGMTNGKFDIFGVGGGSGGNGSRYGDDIITAAGGAGGFTKTLKSQTLSTTSYKIIVGAGGNGGTGGFSKYDDATDDIIGGSGGKTSFGSILIVNGATDINIKDDPTYYYYPRSGGSAGGWGSWVGTNGSRDGRSNGDSQSSDTDRYGGTGQGTTTREFGDSAGKLYAGGGGGGCHLSLRSGDTKYLMWNTYNGGSGGGGAGAGGSGNTTNPKNTPTHTYAVAGTANTGGGGGAGGAYAYGAISSGQRVDYSPGAAGGSGIVCIRNAR